MSTADIAGKLRARAAVLEAYITAEPVLWLDGLNSNSLAPYLRNEVRAVMAAEYRAMAEIVLLTSGDPPAIEGRQLPPAEAETETETEQA